MKKQESRLTKEQVEARLDERTASIAGRIDALEKELPVSTKRIGQLTRKKTWIKIGGFVAAGLFVGAIIASRRRDPMNRFQDGVDQLASDVSREIRKNMKRGMDEEEAVSAAVRKRPPVLHMDDRSGLLVTVLSQLSRHVVTALGPVIVDKITTALGKSDEEKK